VNRGIIAIVIAFVAAVALAAWWILVQVDERHQDTLGITGIVFHQSQAIEDFDETEYTEREGAALDEFQMLLDEFAVVPGETQTGGDACPGALTSVLAIEYSDGDAADLELTTCGAPAAYETFNQEATALLSDWHKQLAG
jgi:hypothetical protein